MIKDFCHNTGKERYFQKTKKKDFYSEEGSVSFHEIEALCLNGHNYDGAHGLNEATGSIHKIDLVVLE